MRYTRTPNNQTLAGPERRADRLSRACGFVAAVIAACSLCDSAVGSTNLVADSVADYSIVQGQSNWYYGYCSNNYSVGGFVPFSATANCCGLGDYWWTGQNVWTAIWRWGGCPNGLDGNGGRERVLHCAVRRWISTTVGVVSIQGVTSSCDAPGVTCNGGDTTAEIYVDGTLVFSTPVTTSAQIPYSVFASVVIGGVIDFTIRTTGTNEINGGTTFTGSIQEVTAVSYQSFYNQAYSLKPWLGRNIAILTSTNEVLDVSVMNRITAALDKAWDFYAGATGQLPIPYSPTTFLGRDTIAEVSSTCGAGCSYLGFTGTEILGQYFDILYNGVASANQYDQVLFYEFGRNFWFYGDQLAYSPPDTDPVTTGFAVYMRFLSMDAAGVAGGPFNGYSFTTFRTTVTNLMDSYITNSSLNWSNTFRISQAPANPLGLGGTDLIASLLMRIARDFGDASFAVNFWKQAALRPTATTTQTAVDNFILAACATVNKNLTRVFPLTWKFPVSPAALQEAQTRWGDPFVLHPQLSISSGPNRTVLLKWQSQVNTTYQLKQSSNLLDWVNLGGSISGDGAVRSVTNSLGTPSKNFFRLMVQ